MQKPFPRLGLLAMLILAVVLSGGGNSGGGDSGGGDNGGGDNGGGDNGGGDNGGGDNGGGDNGGGGDTPSWQLVGSAGFSTNAASYVSLALDNGDMTYMAYQDGNKATVMRWNGTSWETVGDAGANLINPSMDGNRSIRSPGPSVPRAIYGPS